MAKKAPLLSSEQQMPLFYPSQPISEQLKRVLCRIRHRQSRKAISNILNNCQFLAEQIDAIESSEARAELSEVLEKFGFRTGYPGLPIQNQRR